ncbi:MAG TPA: hypothetical protein VHG28_06130 [Longimicrobiaceae bacterium]|nr:hypothetical protein [Longimicrobiaceae bacterium]
MSRLPPYLDLPPSPEEPPRPKSVRTAVLLALFFGPLGLFYASPVSGLLMTFVTLVAGLATMGIGVLLAWPVCVVWAYVAASGQRADDGTPPAS